MSRQAEPDHAHGGGQKRRRGGSSPTMIEHDAWHGGEIGTMRDLYRRRSTIQARGIARP